MALTNKAHPLSFSRLDGTPTHFTPFQFLNLPVELAAHVITHCNNHTLCALALAGKAAASLVQSQLFGNFTAEHDGDMAFYLQTINERPNLAKLVRHVTIDYVHQTGIDKLFWDLGVKDRNTTSALLMELGETLFLDNPCGPDLVLDVEEVEIMEKAWCAATGVRKVRVAQRWVSKGFNAAVTFPRAAIEII